MTSFLNTALYDIRNTALYDIRKHCVYMTSFRNTALKYDIIPQHRVILTLRAAVKHPMLDGVQALNIYMLAYVVP